MYDLVQGATASSSFFTLRWALVVLVNLPFSSHIHLLLVLFYFFTLCVCIQMNMMVVKASVSGLRMVQVLVEEHLPSGLGLSLCGQFNFPNREHKIGFGISLGV